MQIRARAAVLTTALLALTNPAWAVSVGTTDSFESGTTEGWGTGDPSPTPPVNVAGGGPAGVSDNYLLLSATGVAGPGGKLVGFSGAQWAGDYIAAGVTGIEMDLSNFGSTELSLRLYFIGQPGATAVTTNAVLLPALSGWLHVSFAVAPEALTGAALDALSGATQFRLFHGSSAVYPGQNVAAQLGIDNVSAVPEPRQALLFVAGLLALGAGRWRRQQAVR